MSLWRTDREDVVAADGVIVVGFFRSLVYGVGVKKLEPNFNSRLTHLVSVADIVTKYDILEGYVAATEMGHGLHGFVV